MCEEKLCASGVLLRSASAWWLRLNFQLGAGYSLSQNGVGAVYELLWLP